MAYVNGYGYGGSPYWQFIDANGNPLSNGKVATYIAGTTTAYNTLKDWNSTYNGVVFDLDIRGGCTMIWPTTQLIKIIVKDVDGNLFKTLDNIQASGSEGGYIPGTTVIRVDGTDNEIISTASADPEDPTKLIFTISLDPAITEAIATNASDIGGIQTHINNIDNSITTINDTLDTLQRDVDIVESDVDIVEGDVAALKLSDQYTTFKATSAAGSGGYTFKIATALKTKAPLTSTTILEYDLTNNYLGKINAAWGMRGHVAYQQIMQMDDQYSAVDYMHYTHLYEFPDRWELWGHTAAAWAGDISVRPSKNISIDTTIHVNPWVFVGKAVSASLPTVYTEHNWIDYTMPVNDSKKTSVWAEVEGTSDHKVMIDANDQGAKYLNDKILTGGILSKAIEAAGEVGDWYEVLRLTATLYTDGVTCSGAGTSEDPLVALSDHESFINIDDTNSPYLIPESVDEIIVSTATDDVVVTLPVTSLKRFYVKWLLGTHNLTVNVADSGMIDGVASFVFNDKFSVGTSVSFVCKESGDWIANGTITDGSSGSGEVAHIATGDSLGAKDIIQLQAGSSTQWSAHGAMCSTIGAITPGILSEMGFIATQVVAGNFIIAAYKVETNLNHSLICSTGVTALPSSAGWINTPVLNHVKAIAANDRVYLVVMTDSNGNAMAGASCTEFNIQPYVAGIKTNMGVLTEAPSTLTFESETTSRPFIYMVK